MHGAAVRFHKMPDYGKTQAQSAMQTCSRRIRLAEPFEHVRKKFGFNPDARVHDADFRMALNLRQLHQNAAAVRRELHGIRNQVPHDLLKTIRIT